LPVSRGPHDFSIGQSVYCLVWELLSIYDNEGIVMSIDGDIYTVKFDSGDKKIHKKALEER